MLKNVLNKIKNFIVELETEKTIFEVTYNLVDDPLKETYFAQVSGQSLNDVKLIISKYHKQSSDSKVDIINVVDTQEQGAYVEDEYSIIQHQYKQ